MRRMQRRGSRGRHERFDVIFLDPPFDEDPWSWLLPACEARLAPGGFLYAESPRESYRPRRSLCSGMRGPDWCIIICCALMRIGPHQ